jgi:hypothetical protein
MAAISLRDMLEVDDRLYKRYGVESPGNSLRSRIEAYEVHSVRELIASITAKKRHFDLFGNFGLLGAPLSNGVVATENGYRQEFDFGSIDVIMDPLNPPGTKTRTEVWMGAEVRYIGLRCNEPNEVYDDPYVIFTVINVNPHQDGRDNLEKVVKIGPLDDIDEGVVIGDPQTVWDGRVAGSGLGIGALVVEHDSGDPDAVREEVASKIREYVQEGAAMIAQAFGAGAAEARDISDIEPVNWVSDAIAFLSVGILDLGDDEIGKKTLEIWPATLRRLADGEEFQRSLTTTTEGYTYNHKIDVSSNKGDYSVYCLVRPWKITVEIPDVEPPPP